MSKVSRTRMCPAASPPLLNVIDFHCVWRGGCDPFGEEAGCCRRRSIENPSEERELRAPFILHREGSFRFRKSIVSDSQSPIRSR